MAFKMKAGKEGPMKKNFASAFKKDIPEVTVKDKEARALVLNTGYARKDGKYYRKPKDQSVVIYTPSNEVSMSEATTVKRKSRVSKGYRGFGPDKVIGGSVRTKGEK